jgi:NAD(P)-dependent dehydrogenase (short-subunit alcohol dehydrogenase family)
LTEISRKTALVTGGGTGIGMGLAKELARQGAAVAVADILIDNARAVADEINAGGGKALAIHCDVCERDSIRQLKVTANAALGPIQLLFANAGATSFQPLTAMSDQDVDWIVQVNLMGVINTTRAFLPDMMAARSGHIVATASMAGLLPGWIPVHTVYSAAKMGIIGLMMNLALEMKDYGVHVTTYCPKAEVQIPKASFQANPIPMYTPAGVAPIVLHAVRNNRPLVFDHAEQRDSFRKTYAAVVEACYDDIEAYEREHGTPSVVRRLS